MISVRVVTDDLGVHATAYDGASSRPLSQTTALPGQGTTPFLTRSV